jgi:hypothetical protein
MSSSGVQEKFIKGTDIQRKWKPFETQGRGICADQALWDDCSTTVADPPGRTFSFSGAL